MNFLFSPPSLNRLITLLRAWRLWVLGALLGAILSTAFYFLFPPPYQARATVNVDFNMEQAWPQESDRQQFYYLEREVRKLEEIAWSDDVLQAVSASTGGSDVARLRGGILQLSQPAEAGWHFYARAQDPARAQALASAWAQAFTSSAQQNIETQQGLNSFIRLELTQASSLPVQRSIPLGSYLLAGVVLTWFLVFLAFLFFQPARPAIEQLPGTAP